MTTKQKLICKLFKNTKKQFYFCNLRIENKVFYLGLF